ncbi:hypothetical protein GCM10009415_36270 [Chitinophaga japonensis]
MVAPFLLFIVYAGTTGCAGKEAAPVNNCAADSGRLISLKAVVADTLRLYLDSLLVVGVQTPVQYVEKENALLVYDGYNKRLLSYPLDAGTALLRPGHIQPLHLDGKVTYFQYLRPDSLLLYTYDSFQLLFYNMAADSVYKTLSFTGRPLPPNLAFNPAPPNACNAAPIILKDHTIIGVGYLIGEREHEVPEGRTLCTEIHLPDGKVQHKVPYSKVYRSANWGGVHMRTPYAAYNATEDKLLLSLPADHRLQVIDSAWQVKDIYAGTREPCCISALPFPKTHQKMKDPDMPLRYFTGTPSYRNIIFDPYRQRYYRLLQLPPAATALNHEGLAEKHAKIIAFDTAFHYLGEASLPGSLALDNFFVTARGLYFLDAANKDSNIGRYVQIKMEL